MARLTDKVIAKIQELSNKGNKAATIAASLGVSKRVVYKYVKATPAREARKVEAPKAEAKAEAPKAPKEPKAPKDYAVLFGAHVTREAIEKAAAGLEPHKVRKYSVEVGGKTFPVCQLVAAASQIPEDKKQFFTSEDAKRVLGQLQFSVVTSPTA